MQVLQFNLENWKVQIMKIYQIEIYLIPLKTINWIDQIKLWQF